jgi:dihydroflavonol-4-reductase
MATNNRKVLLTGITGFLGSHTAIQLLQKGYQVTGTLRDMKRVTSIKNIIARHTTAINNLSFAEADIQNENVWMQLTQGMDYVQHIASPFPQKLPKQEDDLIIPARNGNLNILKAAAANGVKRVVITSSSSAIIYGKTKTQNNGTFDEKDWTDENRKEDIAPYYKSKTIAEKAAWDFIKKDSSGLELAVVCPGAILGPILEEDFGTSANIVIKMMDGSVPGVPNIGFDMVDVRSVADQLIRCMELPQAANQRYIASAGYMNFKQIAAILKQAYPERKIPYRQLPNWLVRFVSNFDATLKPILIDLGAERKLNHSKAKEELGWQPIDNKEAVLACAASAIQVGIIKN